MPVNLADAPTSNADLVSLGLTLAELAAVDPEQLAELIATGAADDVVAGWVESGIAQAVVADHGHALRWGSSDDDHLRGGVGNDLFHGRAGSDTVSFADGIQGGVVLDLGGWNWNGFVTAWIDRDGDGVVDETDLLWVDDHSEHGIEDAVGSAGDDILTGNGGDNQFYGSAGNDHLVGGGGFDVAHYGDLGVRIILEPGGVVTKAGLGSDVLGTYDSATGTLAALEKVVGAAGHGNVVDGTAGFGPVALTVDLQSGTLAAHLSDGYDGFGAGLLVAFEIVNFAHVTGGREADHVVGDDAGNRLRGGGEADVIFGKAGSDKLFGGAGDDVLGGTQGRDLVHGNAGDDTLFGGAWHDIVAGGIGHDTLRGNTGNDELRGDSGRDSLHGGGGADLLRGGTWSDVLDGGTGDDHLWGGRGADLFIYIAAGGLDTIHDFAANDVLKLRGFVDVTAADVVARATVADGNTSIDVDGDGNTDLQLLGFVGFGADDVMI